MEAQGTHAPIKVTVIIDDKPYHFDEAEVTGLELKDRAGIPEANLLFLEVPGPGDDRPIADTDRVILESGEHFYDMPPGNFGAYR